MSEEQSGAWHRLVFASDPLPAATEVSGLPWGHLELVANKRDFDFGISIFELRRDGGSYLDLPVWRPRPGAR